MHYIVGDIHANITELDKLLEKLRPKKGDVFIFLGDYLDKNIYTKEILKFLFSLSNDYKCIFIKGNHDFVWEQYLLFKDISRQDYLLKYGSVKTLQQFSDNPQKLIKQNQITLISKYLKQYLDLIQQMVDYYIIDNYIALHAGISENQIMQKPLQFTELNYFIRPENIDKEKKYLDIYKLVASHTFLDTKPLIKNAYINIDLGAGYKKFLGAFCVEKEVVIRSDGLTIPV